MAPCSAADCVLLYLRSQPKLLTQILEYSNLIFSALFAVEMLLKVVADGLCAYIRVGFNVFDGLIVILRLAYEFVTRETFRSVQLQQALGNAQAHGLLCSRKSLVE